MTVLLLGIAFLAGVITAISPCVFPVLPILLAGGASSRTARRPFAIVAGLVASFAVFTLFAAWILDRLGLPKDLLRNVAIALLFLLAATLVVPRLGDLLERPLARLTRRRGGDLGGGFLLGASLGLVFTPCTGPIFGYITTQAGSVHFGWRTIVLTVTFALGAGAPMLLIAAGGRRVTSGVAAFRVHAVQVRAALGVLMAGAALAIVFHGDRWLQTRLGDYTAFFQRHTEKSATATRELDRLRGGSKGAAAAADSSGLADFGRAPGFTKITHWLNTPGERPLTLAGLRGKVVLVDFWTYSCINCLRTLPHLEAWDRAYRSKGLVIVGVHTPEFAFEHELSNVRAAARELGVGYAVALDNDYGTWNAYSNQYWPAEYLIDRNGHLRHAHFGEGEYGTTERLIRRLLGETAGAQLTADVPDRTPTERTTPESYLGYERLARFAGQRIVPNAYSTYALPTSLAQNELAFGGSWRVEPERIVAGPNARLRLHFHAKEVFLVLGGRGTVDVLVDGRRERRFRTDRYRLYTLVSRPALADALLELRFAPGVQAYAFTFG